MAKRCREFGPTSDCCPSCHDGVHIGEQDLLVIYRSDGSVYANVCCKKSALAKEALRDEELLCGRVYVPVTIGICISLQTDRRPPHLRYSSM